MPERPRSFRPDLLGGANSRTPELPNGRTAPFLVSDELREALSSGTPIVALETALLTHGLPRPLNLETFHRLDAAVRGGGAVPAAVCVRHGRVVVGVAPDEAERLAVDAAVKVGLADLPAVAARGQSGGTTVATTLWAARRVGIDVFATGGIGGVHRGAAETFDVSGDLSALARFGGCVVCSGAKAILDLRKTFELLETLGVCVLGYRAEELPAFTCRSSGLRAVHRVDAPEEVAGVLRVRDLLGLLPAVLVANPPPAEVALAREVLEEFLSKIPSTGNPAGQELTPHLLRAVAEATGGESLKANVALLEANARLGAEIAGALAAGRGPVGSDRSV